MAKSRNIKNHKKKSANYRKQLKDMRTAEFRKCIQLQKEHQESRAKRLVHESKTANKQAEMTSKLVSVATDKEPELKLIDRIPESLKEDFEQSKAFKLGEHKLIKTNTKDWPGTHKNVRIWYELEGGVAVGVNVFQDKISFPIAKINK